MKKMLMTATVPFMIGQFNMDNIDILLNMGYEIHVACNFKDTSIWPRGQVLEFVRQLKKRGIQYHQIDFSRSPKDITRIQKSFLQINSLLKRYHFHFVHCHAPVASVITRICCRRHGIKVIYTAHGFHFFDGAPKKNWLIYYPIEKELSRITDVLITMNHEDYRRAKEHFHAKKTVYIPGVGVDIEKFAPRPSGRERIRTELGLKDDQIMLLSVGGLNETENYKTVIRAIRGLRIVYVIVDKGKLEDKLAIVAKECGVDLRLMGFRNDMSEFYDAADVYVLPSIREGLNVGLMEAMASGLPVACGGARGNTDFIKQPLFTPGNHEEIREAIQEAIQLKDELGKNNFQKMKSFDLHNVKEIASAAHQGDSGEYGHLIDLLSWQEKRREIGVPWDAKLLMSVGELSVRKNHKIVIEALNRIQDKSIYYIIVGKGSLRNELVKLDKTGRLKFLGYRTDIVDLLHCSDIFVFPSLQEGLPVALMEAMAAGLPCVASRIRGNEDLIEDGVEGYMVDPQDIDGFIHAIKKLAFFHSKIIKNQNKMANFDVSVVKSRMIGIYDARK